MKKAVNTLLAGAVAFTIAGAATGAMAMDKEGAEKCYGVVKAGMNGCASADGKHSCAGQATEDANANEWIHLPTGVCEKLANGSITPPASAVAPAEDAAH
jgi:uncharacterized membrane protein